MKTSNDHLQDLMQFSIDSAAPWLEQCPDLKNIDILKGPRRLTTGIKMHRRLNGTWKEVQVTAIELRTALEKMKANKRLGDLQMFASDLLENDRTPVNEYCADAMLQYAVFDNILFH